MLPGPSSVSPQSLYALALEYGNALGHPSFEYEDIHSDPSGSVGGSFPSEFSNLY